MPTVFRERETPKMNATSRRFLSFVAPLAVALGAMGFAWACNPNPWIKLDPEAGISGTQVTVTGDLLKESRVELTWQSYDGPVLGEATGPKFSLTITIPEAEDGSYLVLAQAWDAEGNRMDERANAVFTVESEAAPPPPSNEEPPPAGGGEPKPDNPPARGNDNPDRGARGDRGSRPAAGGAPSGRFSGPSTAVTTAMGPVFEASLPPDPGRRVPGRSAAGRLFGEAPVPAELDSQTATEMWSGLREGRSASVSDPLVDAGSPEARTPMLVAGIILLALGLLGVFGGFLVAEVRRRRAGSEAEDLR